VQTPGSTQLNVAVTQRTPTTRVGSHTESDKEGLEFTPAVDRDEIVRLVVDRVMQRVMLELSVVTDVIERLEREESPHCVNRDEPFSEVWLVEGLADRLDRAAAAGSFESHEPPVGVVR
jgi:hypothetical protein